MEGTLGSGMSDRADRGRTVTRSGTCTSAEEVVDCKERQHDPERHRLSRFPLPPRYPKAPRTVSAWIQRSLRGSKSCTSRTHFRPLLPHLRTRLPPRRNLKATLTRPQKNRHLRQNGSRYAACDQRVESSFHLQISGRSRRISIGQGNRPSCRSPLSKS